MSTDTPPTAPEFPQLPPRPPRPPRIPPLPFSLADITASWTRPLQLIDLVIAGPARIATNVERRESLWALVVALLLASTAFAVPYGCVIGADAWWSAWWRIIVLYLGSTLICLPSLHVFSGYLGLRTSFAQILVLALTIPAVAAVFTFGFAPILGFLRATMDANSDVVSWRSISVTLLVFALIAGVGQLWRCFAASQGIASRFPFFVVLLAWHWVFVHVLLRMGSVLDL
jgi:hypothetical protein